MTQEVKTITLPLPYRMGTVNCYLVEAGARYVLIDTGGRNCRAILDSELASAGCKPGNLALVALTHGDFDHTGNGAYLRQKYGVKIAMHPADAGMAEHGDMFWSRESGNFLLRALAPILFRFGKSDRFEPDFYVEDGYDFASFGFDARVVEIPGHSKGSIGFLTSGGDLFSGDLLEYRDKPAPNSLMDDPAACEASLEKLERLDVRNVYPGHGQPFPIGLLFDQGHGSQ